MKTLGIVAMWVCCAAVAIVAIIVTGETTSLSIMIAPAIVTFLCN